MSTLRKLFKKQYALRKSFRCLSGSSQQQQDVNIVKSPHEDVEIPNISLPELVYHSIEKFHKYTAFVCAETGRSYTFEDVGVNSKKLSKALRTIVKLEKGDTIAILLPNIPEYPICVLGALEAGLIATTINPIYTPDEISKQLQDSSAKAIITLVSLYDNARSAANLTKKQLPIVTIKTRSDQSLPQGAINYNELLESTNHIQDFKPCNPDDIAILPYSSGTTGLPKGVQLTHKNIVSNICQMDSPNLNVLTLPSENHQDVTPAVLPMFHIYGLTVTTLGVLKKGCRVITLSKFTPDLYISVLKNYRINIIYAAPPLVLFLTHHPEVKKEYLQYLSAVMSGAAPLGALDEEKFLQKAPVGVKIMQGYGLTETSPVLISSTKQLFHSGKASGSIGQLLPNTLAKIVPVDDPTGTPLGPNQSGELLVKGPQVMKGYHNKPEETKNSFSEGWFRTGDLGHYNEDQLFYITDRLKELIKVKGFQVAPAELEEIIRDFPSVEDAAVVGVPDPIQGELPKAFVVPKKDQNLNTDDLAEYVAKKVAPYKQLKGGIEVIESIPKNAAGKILRRELKLRYAASN